MIVLDDGNKPMSIAIALKPNKSAAGLVTVARLVSVLTLLLAFIVPFTADASWKTEREVLDHQLRFDRFKVYFTTSGKAAFFTEKRPDSVAMETKLFALRDQLLRADHLYQAPLSLLPPPNSPKQLQADHIHLHVLAMDKKNGSAGDTVQRMNYRHFKDSESALLIALTSRWQPGNLTPEHEVFHLYQYGYTHFKNPWYLEGMAASMEFYFRDGLVNAEAESLPKTTAEINSLLKRSYSAKVFWNKMLQSCLPVALQQKFDHKALQQSDANSHWLKVLLEQLAAQDLQAAEDRGLNPERWPEKEQRSGKNHRYILQAIQNSLRSCEGQKSSEIQAFSQAIDRYKAEL